MHRTPTYPFGCGLSYTEFELQNGRGWADSENFYGEITVTNIGKREGAEVIQMYIGCLLYTAKGTYGGVIFIGKNQERN